eukprot:scaffold2059_cov342-Prasinococcus_capsulatus_cf.AAC.9
MAVCCAEAELLATAEMTKLHGYASPAGDRNSRPAQACVSEAPSQSQRRKPRGKVAGGRTEEAPLDAGEGPEDNLEEKVGGDAQERVNEGDDRDPDPLCVQRVARLELHDDALVDERRHRAHARHRAHLTSAAPHSSAAISALSSPATRRKRCRAANPLHSLAPGRCWMAPSRPGGG